MTVGRRWLLSGMTVLAVVAITGCFNRRFRTYPGPPRPAREIALLEVAPLEVKVQTVDGKRYEGWTEARIFELLPGEHRMEVTYSLSWEGPPHQTVDAVQRATRDGGLLVSGWAVVLPLRVGVSESQSHPWNKNGRLLESVGRGAPSSERSDSRFRTCFAISKSENVHKWHSHG